MAAKVDREEFLRQLQMVKPGLSSSESIQQSDCFVFDKGRLITFNDEILCMLPCDVIQGIRCAVPATRLLAILGEVKDDELRIDMTGESLTLIGKRKRTRIRRHQEVELPFDTVAPPSDSSWKPLHEDFAEAIKLTSTCPSKDPSEFSLTYIHITPEYVEATDRLQFARFKVPFPVKKHALVKPQSIHHIAELGATEVAVTKSWLYFRSPNGLVVACRRYVDEYPELESKIDISLKGKKLNLPKSLAHASTCANIFSSEDSDNNYVTVLLKNGKLRVTGVGSMGDHTEWKDIKYTGPSRMFAIHPNLLADLTSRHNECMIDGMRLGVSTSKFIYMVSLRQMDEADRSKKEKAANDSN